MGIDSVSDSDLRIQTARETAESLNCDLVIADDYHLQLDLDSEMQLEQSGDMRRKLDFVLSQMGIEIVRRDTWKSKSGNTHIVFELDSPIPVERRILLQACMGSDPIREILSFARVVNNIDIPVLLYRPRPKPEDPAIEIESSGADNQTGASV